MSTQDRSHAQDDKLAALHRRLAEQVKALRTGEDWMRWLDVARQFRTYSFHNTLLILSQQPNAERVAGYRAWQALGRQVNKGEKGIQILAPILRRGEEFSDEDERDQARRRTRLAGYRVTHIWSESQTSGDPLPEQPSPGLLTGEAPPQLWNALADLLADQGFTLDRGDCHGANGFTHFGERTVRVRDDVDDAQAVKTLAHELLTAPSPGCSRSRKAVAQAARRCGPRGTRRGCAAAVVRLSESRAGDHMGDQVSSRDVSRLAVPVVGAVVAVDGVPGYQVTDAAGQPVAAVTAFLSSLLASGASPGSARSYASALLRWWRFLAAVGVGWDRAAREDVRDFVLWMRFAARPGGYAPATINHNLAVVRAFYADRLRGGDGPVVSPVPDAEHRAGRRAAAAHHNPMSPVRPGSRAPLRQKLPERRPRGLPDDVFDALFAVLGCDRDRALLAFYVSTGARASELLGVTIDRVDPGGQRIGVHRKGSGRLQWLPASPDAFVWLRLYQQHQPRPAGQRALWLTRRSPHGPLTYSAARRMLQRANQALGTGWTLHDLRHTAAQRMVDDPRLSLTDVQWVLGHAHLTTTQIYLRPREDEVVARVLAHQRSRGEPRPQPPPSPPVGAYRRESVATLLGGDRRG